MTNIGSEVRSTPAVVSGGIYWGDSDGSVHLASSNQESDRFAEFEQAADNKLGVAQEIDEDAVYLSETSAVEQLLGDFRTDLINGEFEGESVPTEAVQRLRFGEQTTLRLLQKTGEADPSGIGDEQIAVTTTGFIVNLGVSLVMMQLSFTDLLKDSNYGNILPDSQLLLDDIDDAVNELVSLGFSEAMQSEALSEIISTAQVAYNAILDDQFDTADEFTSFISDSLDATAANLTLQQTIETGGGFTPLADQLPIGVIDQFSSAEQSLAYLHDKLDSETIQADGLEGNLDGALTALNETRDQINEVASITNTFLTELDQRVDYLGILKNVYNLTTGIRDDEALWRLAGVMATLVTKAGLAVAAVRAIGVLVGEVSIRLMMTVNARGIIGIKRGEPAGIDDIEEFLPDVDDIVESLNPVDNRWGEI